MKSIYKKNIKRILLLTDSFQSLTQRIFVELIEKGYDVSIEFDINPQITKEAIKIFEPDLIIAPYLKSFIPEEIFSNVLCWIVHPGIKGDKGPSALDYAILNEEKIWGTTIIEASAEWDSGDIWASYEFPMRTARKSSIYRNEITEAAVKGIFEALYKLENGIPPEPLDYSNQNIKGKWNPYLKQEQRKINWEKDPTKLVLKKIYASDSHPGVLDIIENKEIYLFNAFEEKELSKEFKSKKPGEWLAKRDNALLRKTLDGAVWIQTMKLKKDNPTLKLPSTYILPEIEEKIPEIPIGFFKKENTFQEIYYTIEDKIGYLYFNFYNGAMSTNQCKNLLKAYKELKNHNIEVIVLMGGEDFFSNGIHLNIIENSESPALESWHNIQAMDDLCEEIIKDTTHLTISVFRGNAGAGGCYLALTCDYVFAKKGVILNPHYKSIGNLYGSEYWTYLLPKRVKEDSIKSIINLRLPISTKKAKEIGFIDDEIVPYNHNFEIILKNFIKDFIKKIDLKKFIQYKKMKREEDEMHKPLQKYRDEELEQMKRNFFGFDPSYHIARYYFVYKIRNFRTPLYLAKHRRIKELI